MGGREVEGVGGGGGGGGRGVRGEVKKKGGTDRQTDKENCSFI